MRNNAQADRYFIHSLGRGLRYLELLAESNAPMNLSQVAEALGHSRATCGIQRLCCGGDRQCGSDPCGSKKLPAGPCGLHPALHVHL